MTAHGIRPEPSGNEIEPHDAATVRIGARSRPAIVLTGLTKRFGRRTVVDQLDVTVPPGVVCGLVGPNGAGKTTTLRMLLGLVHRSAGTGEVLGVPLDRPDRYLARVGALVESPAFYPGLSARRNLEVQAILGRVEHPTIDGLLEQVGLLDRADDPYHTYSLGMKQRLGIAAALLGEPEVLILDEPTNGLDPAGIREMREFIGSLRDEWRTVIVSSHLLSEVQQVCDWLVVVRDGRCLYQGRTDQLAAGDAWISVRAEHVEDTGRLAALFSSPGAEVRRVDDRLTVRPRVDASDDDALLRHAASLNRAAARADITLAELTPLRSNLEDRYLTLIDETT
jgi:ABC-2 type transport system ATP-binding protein